jgi:putative intracellular protease/amidase
MNTPQHPKRILMVLTSNDRMDTTGKPTGLWADELAEPFYALTGAGAEVTLASTIGGPVPVDPGSVKPLGQNEPAVDRMLNDEALQRGITHTHRVDELSMKDFDAVFFPGGHGTMWDLPKSEGVRRIVEEADAQGKVIAAVCHGVAGLVTALRPDGEPVISGRRINSFTDSEERAAGLANVVPFLLESRLRTLGAKFENGPDWQPFAVRDGTLITGQNPRSSLQVAELVIEALQKA